MQDIFGEAEFSRRVGEESRGEEILNAEGHMLVNTFLQKIEEWREKHTS